MPDRSPAKKEAGTDAGDSQDGKNATKGEEASGKQDTSGRDAATPARGGSARQVDEARIESTVLGRHDYFQTTINGVTAQNFVVGMMAHHDYRAGPLDERVVRAALEYFHPPSQFASIRTRMVTDHLVILCGPEGSGRQCAAFKLLEELGRPGNGTTIEVLAPETPVSELLDRQLESHGRYLLADYFQKVDDRQSRYEIGELQRKLKALGAFLVVTTEVTTTAFGPSAMLWQPPSTAEAFAANVDTTDPELTTEQTTLVRRVVATLPLHRLAQFIANLRTDGPESACAPYGDEVRAEFQAWLDKDPLHVHDLAPIIAAALLPEAPEREHESRSVDLTVEIDTRACRDRATADYTSTLRPSRRSRASVLVRRPDPLGPGGHVVAVNEELTAEAVLSELHTRYGDELWVPIRAWLHEMPVGCGPRLLPLLAVGVAGLTQIDLGLVDHVLDTWAGDRDDDRRWVAALANSALCRGGQTAGNALNRAARWSGGNQQAKITATHAFGLELSEHLPTQAVCRLWNLTFGDVVVATYARAELMAVLRRAMQTGKRLARIVAIVVHQFDYLIANVPADDRRIDRALTTLSRLLAVRLADGVPMTVVVLRDNTGTVAGLGHLWAHVIQSWPHRVAALDELHAAQIHLDVSLAEALGAAMHREMSPTQWKWLCRDLGADIREGKATTEVVR